MHVVPNALRSVCHHSTAQPFLSVPHTCILTCQVLQSTSAWHLVSHKRAPHGCWGAATFRLLTNPLAPKFRLPCLPSCAPTSQEYLAIEGLEAFRKATVDLLLGADHPAIKEVSSRGQRA